MREQQRGRWSLLTLQGILGGWWMGCASVTGHHTAQFVAARADANITAIRPHHLEAPDGLQSG